jgi:hypothetical protein
MNFIYIVRVDMTVTSGLVVDALFMKIEFMVNDIDVIL